MTFVEEEVLDRVLDEGLMLTAEECEAMATELHLLRELESEVRLWLDLGGDSPVLRDLAEEYAKRFYE